MEKIMNQGEKHLCFEIDGISLKNDPINPNHYEGVHGLTVREVQENFAPYYRKYEGLSESDASNIIKYILRAPNKNGLEDLLKLQEYLGYLIEEVKAYEED